MLLDEANISRFKGRKLIFESKEIIEEGTKRKTRIVDVKGDAEGLAKATFFEFKSVGGIPPNDFADQFLKDLQFDEVTSLDQLVWIFDGRKIPDKGVFKAEMVKAIRKLKVTDNSFTKFDDLIDIQNPTMEDLKRKIIEKFETIFIVNEI